MYKRMKQLVKAAIPLTIPVMTGYLFLGMAFGILLDSKGYSFIWAFFMSLFIYAGSMQFVAIDLLTSAFQPLSAIMMTLIVNARHLFYGLSMLGKYKGAGKKKPYMIFALTDETFSLLCYAQAPNNINPHWFRFTICLLDQCYWIIGSVIGGILGTLITIPTKGIDFVMTALFLVIFVEQWKTVPNHLPAITGVLVSVLCLLVFGPEQFILPAMLGILLVLTLLKKPIQERKCA